MKIDVSHYEKSKPKTKSKTDFNFGGLSFKRFSDKQKEAFYREFSTLISSGIDFNQAIKLLTEQQKSKHIKQIYEAINNDVVKGRTLHEAIKAHKQFSPYEYYSIKIGEETRRLPEVFKQLETYYSRKIAMKRQVISVLAYPFFVLIITFAVLYFMLNYVVPMFATVFQQFGKDLPSITQFVVNLSKHFNTIAIVALGVVFSLIIAHKTLKRSDHYRGFTSHLILKLPFFGKLIKKVYLARFCQSLSLLLSAKTPLITALDLTEKMISFYPLKKALMAAKDDVLKGETLAKSLKKHSFFEQKIISLTIIGEQVNELDKMYNGLADQYNKDIEHSTKMIGTILEPLMIIFIGGIVGFIMIAMYSPIFNLSQILER